MSQNQSLPRYKSFNAEVQKLFGEKIFRITVNAGMTCPNVDGTKAKGGCTFCQETSYTGLTFREGDDIRRQIENGMSYVGERHHTTAFFAYFQNGTNTYAPVEKLRRLYETVLSYPEIKGLFIATRPDCLEDDVMELLSELNKKTYLCVELGLQSQKNDLLKKMNRAHTVEEFTEGVQKLAQNKISTCAHVILGVPGETAEDNRDKARYISSLPLTGVKIHNMVVFRDTTLAKQYESKLYEPLSLETYTEWCVEFLEELRPDIWIHRLNAHGPRHDTVAPEWSINKWEPINAIHEALEQHNTWQGKKYQGIPYPLSSRA